MKINLENKRALITGSTNGIGFATAKRLLDSGCEVVITGRRSETVSAAVRKLERLYPGSRIQGFHGDLSKAEIAGELKQRHPKVHILVNNLGIYGPLDFFESDDSAWEHIFQTNIMSGVRLARAYLPLMEKDGWGRVIFVSSESGLNIPPDMVHYGMTKTANISVARGLAKLMSGTGVTVNSVLPGPTLSEGLERMLRESSENETGDIRSAAAKFVQDVRPSSIIRRAASVDEVANMIGYLSSEESSATTGAAVRVDGGVVDSIV